MTEPVRLSKLMSERGLCSRREADEYIEKGLVFVDGQKISVLGTRVDPGCEIRLAGAARASQELRVTILLNLFMFGSEQFTEFYTGGAHTTASRYLFFGLHGHHALVPWIWTAVFLNITSAVLVHLPASRKDPRVLLAGCGAAFGGVWIEKGMGLIVPGFVPSTLHELVEYTPSVAEWKICAGLWAFGGLVLLVLLKIVLPVLTGELSDKADAPSAQPSSRRL